MLVHNLPPSPFEISPSQESEIIVVILIYGFQKSGFGSRTVRSHCPLVRRSSMSNGHYDTVARPLPKLLSLELFNPETDDKDSDSSGMSSPDSIESVVENRMKSPMHTSKFPFPPRSLNIGSTTTSKTKTSSSSKSLLEAAADVANSLDEAVEKVNSIIGCSGTFNSVFVPGNKE